MSGRRVADMLNISPTTASKVLKALLDRGLVTRTRLGRPFFGLQTRRTPRCVPFVVA